MLEDVRHRFATSLGLRLVAVLTVTLAIVGVLQYVLVANRLERDLIAGQAVVHEADARSLARAGASAGDGESGLAEVSELLRAIGSRPFVDEAVIVDAAGTVVASSDRLALGRRDREPKLMETARTGRSFDAARSGDHYSYIAPVRIDGRRFAFEIDQDRAIASEEVSGVRTYVFLALVASLVLAVGIFYLLGGRRVDRLYAMALDRARRDGLTGLENHRAFKEELQRAATHAERHDEPLALAVLDVDDFKFVNDERGHVHGDRILVRLARILEAGRAGDRAFRLGGDEFAVLLPGCDLARAHAALDRVCAQALEGLGGVTVSIGVCAEPLAGREPETLWARADAALYEAKRRGGSAVVSSAELTPGDAEAVSIDRVRAVRRLIAEGTIDVAFQPIWDLDGRRVLSFEALARPRDLHGLDGPGEAFDIAERIGRGHELDALCRAAALSRAHLLPRGALLFLNVAPQSLDSSALAGDALLREVRAAGLRPEGVVLEITERSEARLPVVMREIERLREMGFRIALDDVGAGNAGLEMLRSVSVDYVKIDRGVVQAAPEDRRARAVLQAIVAFARGVDAYVIAEGIEADDLLAFVCEVEPSDGRTARVRGAQGYLLGRPAVLTEPAEAGGEDLIDARDALRRVLAGAAGVPAVRAAA